MCFSVAIERNLSKLSQLFGVPIDGGAFLELKESSKTFPERYKLPGDDDRLYPQVFGPVIKAVSGKSLPWGVLTPMRYRVRPHDAYEEVPSKFNLFNARLDSLESRKTWRPLFGHNHGLLPFKRFYEWVEGEPNDQGRIKKELVSFSSSDHEYLMAPVLYDYYRDDRGGFFSFAIITTEPPKEVLAAGHDRCPIFLKEKFWKDWLKPKERSIDELYSMLQKPESTFYQVRSEESGAKSKESPSRDQRQQLNFFDD
jgi:putative SOS response-associated peptidase YedK